MSEFQWAPVLIAAAAIWGAFGLGRLLGRHERGEWLSPQLDALWRYQMAVDQVDKWCSHMSPEAKLIAAHIKASGEGESRNAGTPMSDEVCDVSGLREQLRRLAGSRIESLPITPEEHPPCPTPSPTAASIRQP